MKKKKYQRFIAKEQRFQELICCFIIIRRIMFTWTILEKKLQPSTSSQKLNTWNRSCTVLLPYTRFPSNRTMYKTSTFNKNVYELVVMAHQIQFFHGHHSIKTRKVYFSHAYTDVYDVFYIRIFVMKAME